MVLLRFIRSSMFDRWRAKVSTPPGCARNSSIHAPCELENVGRVSSSERQRPPRYPRRIGETLRKFKPTNCTGQCETELHELSPEGTAELSPGRSPGFSRQND